MMSSKFIGDRIYNIHCLNNYILLIFNIFHIPIRYNTLLYILLIPIFILLFPKIMYLILFISLYPKHTPHFYILIISKYNTNFYAYFIFL